MTSAAPQQSAEWEGGSLADLMAALQASAQPIRIEVIAPGAIGGSAGEVHLLAGGMADAVSGSLRRDDAVAALQRIEGARFLVETRLPEPERHGEPIGWFPAVQNLNEVLIKLNGLRYPWDYLRVL